MSCFLFCLFTRFELATRGSKCVAFGRNSPGDCFAASALYLCARLLLSAGGAAGMSCFLFCLFARIELATRGSKCAAFGRNSPGDCFAASALYFCDRLLLSAGGAVGMSCFLFCLFTRFELATRGSKCEAFGRNSPGDCFAASALYLCADYSFLPVEQPECPASFFVYLQDLNLRHEAPNAKHLAETVQGTVSQQVPCISVVGCLFSPAEQHFFSGVAVIGNARYKKAGQF